MMVTSFISLHMTKVASMEGETSPPVDDEVNVLLQSF